MLISTFSVLYFMYIAHDEFPCTGLLYFNNSILYLSKFLVLCFSSLCLVCVCVLCVCVVGYFPSGNSTSPEASSQLRVGV